MRSFSIPELGNRIKAVFTATHYQMEKHVPTFTLNGAYAGDCFNQDVFEPRGDKPPIFYHFYSPYDVISHKGSQRALAYEAGELLLDIDFSPYISQRTGIMSALVFQALGVTELAGKVLFIGTGAIAREALKALKAYYPTLSSVDFVNTSGQGSIFHQLAEDLGIQSQPGNLEHLSEYHYIICHSSARQPILTAEHLPAIAPGAIITSFASEDSFEVAEEYYDTAKATVIADWDRTLAEATELAHAIASGKTDSSKVRYLRDVFAGHKATNNSAYTIFRSHGTPMQNLAVLKIL